VVGIFMSMIAGVILNKFHKYLLMTRLSAFGTTIILAICIYSFHTKNLILIAVNIICAAVTIIPIIPVGIDFASQLSFPYEETVVTGFILMSA